ncbi:hypothetical protein [Brevundimonas sp.]|uniref:hypothetical protein n=1 Tax=Brevundimonas sp. TaxID=1871086 RepID=UPI002FDAD8AF
MSGFEFFFGFFGLILGLSVVEVITGFGKVLRRRDRVRLGWVTPLLAVFVLLDVASFWSISWTRMQGVEPSYLLLLIGLAIAGVYYLAASLVFPDDLDAWPSLDEFYDQHKRWVIGGVWIAKTLSHTALLGVVGGVDALRAFWTSPTILIVVLWVFPPMLAICLVRNRVANAVMLAWLIMFYVVRLAFLS